MVAVVTGASSGIGCDIAKQLSNKGYDLILVGRQTDKLNELKHELHTKCEILSIDLSLRESCFTLYEMVKDKDVQILVNSAGYGSYNEFLENPLEDDLNLIQLNVETVHILTKLFLKDFIKKDVGYILNVASSAGLLPGGPLLSTYYASKSYVISLSEAIYEELKRSKSNVAISILCPGPVNTNFSNRAGVQFAINGISSKAVADVAVKGLFKKKLIIVPGFHIKAGLFLTRFISSKFLLKITYSLQKSKK